MKSQQGTLSFESETHLTTKSDSHVRKLGLMYVPFTQLKVLDNFNDREDYGTTEEMNQLAESIYLTGPKNPLKGYKDGDKYIVIVGHRRHRAGEMILKKYGKNVVFPLMPYAPGTRKIDMLLDTLLTNNGKDLTPLEKASTVDKLTKENVPTKEIASALGGVSTTYINNLQKLWTLPEAGKKLIRDGIISASLIMGVLKSKGNIEEWIAEVQKQAEKPEKKKKEGSGSKSKTAKITAKNAPGKKLDSVKEFKNFRKSGPEEFPTKWKQQAYEFVSQLVDNKLSMTDIGEFFNK